MFSGNILASITRGKSLEQLQTSAIERSNFLSISWLNSIKSCPHLMTATTILPLYLLRHTYVLLSLLANVKRIHLINLKSHYDFAQHSVDRLDLWPHAVSSAYELARPDVRTGNISRLTRQHGADNNVLWPWWSTLIYAVTSLMLHL